MNGQTIEKEVKLDTGLNNEQDILLLLRLLQLLQNKQPAISKRRVSN